MTEGRREEFFPLPDRAVCAHCHKEIDTGHLDTFATLIYKIRSICLDCYYDLLAED